MIPTSGFLKEDFAITEQPTKTYQMEPGQSHIRGSVTGREAMKQAIFKILNTERYRYVMYSWNYGIETHDLYGEPVSWVCPELERRITEARITEALLWDSRIKRVTDFTHDINKKGMVFTRFTAHTVFGDVESDKEVNY